MEQLEHPDLEIWEERKGWFENELENNQHPMASYLSGNCLTGRVTDLLLCRNFFSCDYFISLNN